MKMNKLFALIMVTITIGLSSCAKDYWWGYHYKLERAHKNQNDWQSAGGWVKAGAITKKQAQDKDALDAETVERWNHNSIEFTYRIDSSYVEAEECFGCKRDWEK